MANNRRFNGRILASVTRKLQLRDPGNAIFPASDRVTRFGKTPDGNVSEGPEAKPSVLQTGGFAVRAVPYHVPCGMTGSKRK